MPPLTKRFGINGGVISAVDIIHGLGVYAGLERIDVPGITGFLDTNYLGKGEYGVRSLEKNDFVFIHVEATDEAGHMGDVERRSRRWKISTKKSSAPCSKEWRSAKIGGCC